ncbi:MULTISPECIES: conditioned medium-induced protein 4 [Halobacterium]|uniref:Conditioned medium-induced protein 4 n=1 Tax=Halobacterium salinarum (strain ATCC 33171 / DSM 3754 / JCM 8978 / NBRC 102687 / NCIMB 764 / 91-R6) TaxID=2597657 RepID=A0A4D6GWQ1_HALS9|nr:MULTISPECIES: conditioned medium-induced protein 4 [Halobacterium]MCF2207202.1 conditioned medium-induced protein 4 [Halobacterium salinarum]MDL0123036.1 conditioned medium-induced protein 4 [Halobacterium salinarum]MDL0125392.1 conditioned medium-induced protein 4 [Halobacterium salinarum]MDL0128922.1 conditioned medium-induced protein 4 [Halobacterium salinarum]MDL0145928.1 conditioned medium-induced protein 4 [Halobacterium salinarum]
MDEKTEELRDIFQSVTDNDTITESQADTHGSLTAEPAVEETLRDTITTMRDRLAFHTDLDTATLVTVVRQFYAGDADDAIAAAADIDARTVRHARLDLHLVRDDDADTPLPLDAVRDAVADPTDPDPDAVADALDAAPEDAAAACDVLRAKTAIQRSNDRYRAEFENVLRDRALTERLTATVHEDGLDDATDGQETDVDL